MALSETEAWGERLIARAARAVNRIGGDPRRRRP
jgi:hypothetical protein